MKNNQSGDRASFAGRVAVVSHSHPSISKGGAEISAYSLYCGLREIGHDAIFIAACARTDKGKLAFGSEHEFAVYFDHSKYSHFYHLADEQVVEELTTLLQIQGIQTVNFHHFLYVGVNALRAVQRDLRLRCFLTIHEFLAICAHYGQMVTRPQQLLCSESSNEACGSCFPEHVRADFQVRKNKMHEAFSGFEGFISPSKFLAARFVQWGLDASRIEVIENGLLTHRADKTRKRYVAAARGEDRCVIGFFGQINPFKGVDVILDAADLIAADKSLASRVQLKIHGNLVGQSEAFLERFDTSIERHPFLAFAGPYNSAVVEDLMGQCDYVLVPSKWWENSPVVIQEAYAVGVPVICTGIGGLAEKVVPGVSGLHFELGDAHSLVEVIHNAVKHETIQALRSGLPAVDTAADMAKKYAAFMGLAV